jgi:hypothetical protein
MGCCLESNYHGSRLHLSLDKDSPDPRPVQSIGVSLSKTAIRGEDHFASMA